MTSDQPRRLIVDVHYVDSVGTAAGLLFREWNSPAADEAFVVSTKGVAPYRPGSFYLRELPCLQRLINRVAFPISTIVIDGYVTLASDQPGLGVHLWNWLNGKVPVIGVAKSAFHTTHASARLCRGTSNRPLFISSAGMSLDEAKACIRGMHGDHRIPTLVREVDRLCRASAQCLRTGA